MPPAAVVDTNILVSALLRPTSAPAAVTRAIIEGRLLPVMCGEIVAQYEDVLTRPRFGFEVQLVSELLASVAQQALWVEIAPYPEEMHLPDPDDWPFVAAALAAGCSIVTGNAKHFPKRLGVEAVTARGWLESSSRSQT